MKTTCSLAGCMAVAAGMLCFMAYSVLGSGLGADGGPLEPFFLIGAGWLLLFLGAVLALIRLVWRVRPLHRR